MHSGCILTSAQNGSVLNEVIGHREEGGAIEYVGGEVTLCGENTKDYDMLDFDRNLRRKEKSCESKCVCSGKFGSQETAAVPDVLAATYATRAIVYMSL